MSAIVGITDGHRVVIGGDSAGSTNDIKVVVQNQKVFYKGPFILGGCGSFRVLQVIDKLFTPPSFNSKKEDFLTYMISKFISSLYICLEENHCVYYGIGKGDADAEDLIMGTFLLGYKNKLVCIDVNFQVIESNNYLSIGTTEIALGALYILCKNKNLSLEQKVEEALQASAEHSSQVSKPFIILST